MAGSTKFELSSVSPDDSGFSGSYINGQRSNYASPSLDRSGSFREGSEGRSFSSGHGTSKINVAHTTDLPPLSQCLNLEPVNMLDLKNKRTVELRRALGSSFGNVSEDNSFGALHSKPPSTLSIEDIKRFKEVICDGSVKARNRIKRWDDSLNKLGKYVEASSSRKQLTNERSGGSNLPKMGTQSHRSSSDLTTQKLEERNKNLVPNKRARTPMGDLRAEGRSNGVPRQALVKDKDGAREGGPDLGEEKIRRLPAVGEGWDKKMKRKRSVSSVFPRSVDGDGEIKRTMHGRLNNDSGNHSSDAQGFRLNMREDPHVLSSGSVTKSKASRAHRIGSASVGNSSPCFSRMSSTIEDWEQPLVGNKAHSLAGCNNRKRTLSTDSSSPPMAQWVGQRPHKISRNRRTNIVSLTSNHDDAQLSSEGCTPTDSSSRIPGSVNGAIPLRNIMSTSQQLKAKLDNASSPARLSESEEICASDNRLKDKDLGGSELDDKSLNGHQHISPGSFTKKNKLLVKDELGDGVRRQGRTGRGSSFPKGSISPLREKLENPVMVKPVRNARPGSEKNGSKSGRPPLKKHLDRKGFTRLGPLSNSSSPDFTGESDDDREELLAAAQFACYSSYKGCSSSFWKRMEPLFCVRAEDKSFLEEQMKAVEDDHLNKSEMPGHGDNHLSQVSQNKQSQMPSFVSGENKVCILDNGLTESAKTGDLVNHFLDKNSSCNGLDSKKGLNSLAPLYQRVLSALIVEDEFEENTFIRNGDFVAHRDNPCMEDGISCNGNATHSRFSSIQVPKDEEIKEVNYGLKYSVGQAGPGNYHNDTNGSLAIYANASANSFEFEYDQKCVDEKLLLELQSIGLYPETVPDLAEGEDDSISSETIQLRKQLTQQVGKKKAIVENLRKAVEDTKEVEARDLEQIAMNRLIELAYKKLLATRGSSAARNGISKVPRHVALAFIRRTLARCRKFEDTGKSCFAEPALRDVLLANPSSNIGAVSCIQTEQKDSRASGANVTCHEPLDHLNCKSDRSPFDAHKGLDRAFAKNGPILNRGKKKEVLLDDVGGNAAIRSISLGSSLDAAIRSTSFGSALMGGAKGKRSERDSGPKAGRPSISNLRGERKAKSKPKQKASQLSTHPVQPSANVSSELVPNNNSSKREALISPGNILDSSKECDDALDLSSLPLTELDSITELNVGNGDLSSWLNFDEDGLQDQDLVGLEIPMDDLSDLNMIL